MSQTYKVEGMSCASCVAHVQKALKGVPGVDEAQVNLLMENATVDGDATFADMAKAVENAGYKLIEPVQLKTMKLDITGMSCASCVSSVEKAVKKLPGIDQVAVNLLLNNAVVVYDPALVKSFDILKAIDDAGYHGAISQEKLSDDSDVQVKQAKRERMVVITALVFAVLVLYIAMAHMFTIKFWLPDFLEPMMHPLNFALAQLLLSLPVVYLGRQYYVGGFKALRHFAPNMDSLVALGTSAAYAYSLYGLVRIMMGDMSFAHHLYFEAGTVVLALIMLGKYFESLSKGKTTAAISALLKLKPSRATLLKDGQEISIDSDEISLDDTLIVKPGESFPADGSILEGTCSVDESMLSGESLPVDKAAEDSVIMGTINLNGRVSMKVLAVNEATKLAKIVELVENAQAQKAPIAKLADQIAGVFVPIVMAIALLSGLGWLISGQSFEFSITIFVTVLVIACPCALGLATPTAIMVGTGKGAEKGIFIKSAQALETSAHLDTIVFDKTGTLTNGKPVVTDIRTNDDESKFLAMVASIETYSEHPLGQAIVSAGQERGLAVQPIHNFKALAGMGVEGQYKDHGLLVGNQALMSAHGLDLSGFQAASDEYSQQGKTSMWVAYDGQICGLIAVADTIKEDAKVSVAQLQSLGYDVIMLTGDHEMTAQAIAKQLGIKHVISQVKPEEKAAKIEALQRQGKKVAMVGDGINDAIALVKAEVGIAVGSGTDVAIESADIVIMHNQLADIVVALRLSKATLRNIKQNLFWAFAYNITGIPLAAGLLYAFGGPLLNPMIAGAAMALSSVSVVSNALRLRRFK